MGDLQTLLGQLDRLYGVSSSETPFATTDDLVDAQKIAQSGEYLDKK